MSIFGTAFDVSKDRWIAFNEDTLTPLSEHETEAEALEACRCYLEREIRRTNILYYLSTHATGELLGHLTTLPAQQPASLRHS
jgi:hypothetical protein